VNDRICQYYLQPRGCIKGDKCDFKHPLSPQGVATNRVCEYYLKARGCNKGQECEFLHPDIQPEQKRMLAAQLPQKSQPCSFFNSPRGCIKGATCDFAHPGFGGMGMGGFGGYDGSMMMGGGMGGMNPNMGQAQGFGGPAPGQMGPKICEFFQTQRGCNKGNACDFAHVAPHQLIGLAGVLTPAGPVSKMGKLLRPKICEFFTSERGCIKGQTCEYIHQQQKPCGFAQSGKGCKKGKFCEFLHTDANGVPFPGMEDMLPVSGKSQKVPAQVNRFAPY